MKVILIHETKPRGGFVASVNGFEGVTGFGKDEMSALRHLVDKLESKNSKFIQRSDWSYHLGNRGGDGRLTM